MDLGKNKWIKYNIKLHIIKIISYRYFSKILPIDISDLIYKYIF